MPKTPKEVLADPTFYQLPEGEQQKVLATLDPSFGALPMTERTKVLQMGKSRLGQTPTEASQSHAQAGYTTAQGAPPPEEPGFFSRLAETTGVPTSFQQLKPDWSVTGPQAAPVMAYRYARDLYKGATAPPTPEESRKLKERPIEGAADLGSKFILNDILAPVGGRGVNTMAEDFGKGDIRAGLGGLAGTAVNLRLMKGFTDPNTAPEFRILAQEAAGAGKEPVLAAERSRLEKHQRALSEHPENVRKIDEVNQARKAETERLNEEARRATDLKNRLAEGDVRQANAQNRANFLKKEMESRRAEARNQAVQAREQVIQRGQKIISQRAIENAKQAYAAVKGGLDARWNTLRGKIGNLPIQTTPIQHAIEKARTDFLMGAPDSLKQFNDLTRMMEDEGVHIDTPTGITPGVRPLSWNEARVHYTALGDRMYSGDLPGNVKRAIGEVRDELDKQLSAVAGQTGNGAEYSSVKSDWGQFKKDWDDMSNLSYSKTPIGEAGSPLARLVRAADPAAAARVLSNERLPAQMARYKSSGLSTGLVDKFRDLERTQSTLDKVKVPAHPARPVAKEFAAAEYPKPKEPRLQRVPMEPSVPPPVNPEQVRLKKLEEYSGRPFRWYDFVTPTGLEHALVKSDTLRRWIASMPRNEIRP